MLKSVTYSLFASNEPLCKIFIQENKYINPLCLSLFRMKKSQMILCLIQCTFGREEKKNMMVIKDFLTDLQREGEKM